jgi:Na+-translocating ferredoxin:NAD+ oxidoreductase RnfG subunit
MNEWVKWTAATSAIVVPVAPGYALEYLSVEAAKSQAFPGAHFVEVAPQRIWKAQSGSGTAGFFIVDHVIGKHLYIDYSVALDANGRVRRVEILQYRESYGGEVANQSWLAQFVGKGPGSSLEMNRDIQNISGATLSSRHVTEGIKRILAYYQAHLR